MTTKLSWGPLKKLIDNKDVLEIIVDRADDTLFATSKGVQKGPVLKKLELNKLATQLMKLSSDPKATSANLSFDDLLVSVIMPPIAPEGPFLRIAKVPDQNFSIDTMVEWKVMTKTQGEYLKKLLSTDQSILLAGKAGSGKTTMFTTMLNAIPENYHLVTVEQSGDLNLKRKRTLRLVPQGRSEKELVELVQLAGDSRGDYMAIAYLQGAEILPFIELIREGYSGLACMSAENVFEALKRLEYKISASAPWMSLEDIRYANTQGFGHIMFQSKNENNKRVISTFARLKFVDGEIKLEQIS